MIELINQAGAVARVMHSRIKTKETFDQAITRFKAELGLSELDYTQSINGDDSVHVIPIKNTGFKLEGSKKTVGSIMWSTEALLGFYDVLPTSTSSATVSGFTKTRTFATASRPLFALSFNRSIDSGTFSSKVYTNTNGTLIHGYQSSYGNSTASRYMNFVIKITSDGIDIVLENPNTSSYTLELGTFNTSLQSSGLVNMYPMYTLFDTPGNELISIKVNPTYKLYDVVDVDTMSLNRLSDVHSSSISWEEDIPTGTTVDVQVAVTLGQPTEVDYVSVKSGTSFVPASATPQHSVYARVIMTTVDNTVSPVVSNINIQIWGEIADRRIAIILSPLTKIRNAIGPVTVNYDASLGKLSGYGAAIDSFEETFVPQDLVKLDNPHHVPKVGVTTDVDLNFFKVAYSNNKSHTELVGASLGIVTVKLTKSGIVDA